MGKLSPGGSNRNTRIKKAAGLAKTVGMRTFA